MTTHAPRRDRPRTALLAITMSLTLVGIVAPATAGPRDGYAGRHRSCAPAARQILGWWTRTGPEGRRDAYERGARAGALDGARAGRHDAWTGGVFSVHVHHPLPHRRPGYRLGYREAYVTAYAQAYARTSVRTHRPHRRERHHRRDHGGSRR